MTSLSPKSEGHIMPKKKSVVRVDDILGEGWMTPNTYCNKFAPLGDFPAVYALVVYDAEWTYKIAYIGMSRRLSKRFGSHHAVAEIKKSGAFYYQTWFKKMDADALRDEERRLIQEYDPPLNLIGKVVCL